MTPSHLQSNFGPVQIAQALLDHGANVNAGNNEGETSLYQELEDEYRVQCDSLDKWFSPPDPFTNYNIRCDSYHEGTTEWFFQGEKFKHWISIGSLLWIHGKRKIHLLFATAQNLMVSDLYSGIWKKHPLVRHFPTRR